MNRPKNSMPYCFIRVEPGIAVEVVWFVKFADGSGCLQTEKLLSSWRDNPEEWRSVLDHLRRQGFVEVSEAKKTGLLLDDWQIPNAPWVTR